MGVVTYLIMCVVVVEILVPKGGIKCFDRCEDHYCFTCCSFWVQKFNFEAIYSCREQVVVYELVSLLLLLLQHVLCTGFGKCADDDHSLLTKKWWDVSGEFSSQAGENECFFDR